MLPLPSSNQCHYTVSFSPCGRWLAAGGSAYAVDVWDLHAPQQPARRLQDTHGPLIRAQFTPNGSLVAVSNSWLRLFEPQMLALLDTRSIGNASRAAVAVNGATVIVSGGGLRRCATNGSDERRLNWSRQEPTTNCITDLAVIEGQIIAAAARPTDPHGWVEVRDYYEGQIIDTVPVTGRPHRIACSADGTLAATLSHGNLSVWNLMTRQAVADRANPKHGGWLSVAFDPHGRRIVTGGIDSTVAVWDATSAGPPLTTFQWGVGPVYAVAFDRDGLRAAAAGHSGAIVWDVDE